MRIMPVLAACMMVSVAQGAKLEYFGHSYFLLEDSKGTRIAIDPYGPEVGYKEPDVQANAVLVTHKHFDHSAVSEVKALPGAELSVLSEKRGEFSVGAV